jgi:hypothetical protein
MVFFALFAVFVVQKGEGSAGQTPQEGQPRNALTRRMTSSAVNGFVM